MLEGYENVKAYCYNCALFILVRSIPYLNRRLMYLQVNTGMGIV